MMVCQSVWQLLHATCCSDRSRLAMGLVRFCIAVLLARTNSMLNTGRERRRCHALRPCWTSTPAEQSKYGAHHRVGARVLLVRGRHGALPSMATLNR